MRIFSRSWTALLLSTSALIILIYSFGHFDRMPIGPPVIAIMWLVCHSVILLRKVIGYLVYIVRGRPVVPVAGTFSRIAHSAFALFGS